MKISKISKIENIERCSFSPLSLSLTLFLSPDHYPSVRQSLSLSHTHLCIFSCASLLHGREKNNSNQKKFCCLPPSRDREGTYPSLTYFLLSSFLFLLQKKFPSHGSSFARLLTFGPATSSASACMCTCEGGEIFLPPNHVFLFSFSFRSSFLSPT